MLEQGPQPFVEPGWHLGEIRLDEGVEHLVNECSRAGGDVHDEAPLFALVVAKWGGRLVSEKLAGMLPIGRVVLEEKGLDRISGLDGEELVVEGAIAVEDGTAFDPQELGAGDVSCDDKGTCDFDDELFPKSFLDFGCFKGQFFFCRMRLPPRRRFLVRARSSKDRAKEGHDDKVDEAASVFLAEIHVVSPEGCLLSV